MNRIIRLCQYSADPVYFALMSSRGVTFDLSSQAFRTLDQLIVDPTNQKQGPPIQDPQFALPHLDPGNFTYNPSGTPWLFTDRSGVTSNNSGFTSSNPPYSGNQLALLQATGSVSQVIPNMPMEVYRLDLVAAQRVSWQTGPQSLAIKIDNDVVATITPTDSNYKRYTADFVVSAGDHTLTLQGTIDEDQRTVFVGDIKLLLMSPQVVLPGGKSLDNLDWTRVFTLCETTIEGLMQKHTATGPPDPGGNVIFDGTYYGVFGSLSKDCRLTIIKVLPFYLSRDPLTWPKKTVQAAFSPLNS